MPTTTHCPLPTINPLKQSLSPSHTCLCTHDALSKQWTIRLLPFFHCSKTSGACSLSGSSYLSMSVGPMWLALLIVYKASAMFLRLPEMTAMKKAWCWSSRGTEAVWTARLLHGGQMPWRVSQSHSGLCLSEKETFVVLSHWDCGLVCYSSITKLMLMIH